MPRQSPKRILGIDPGYGRLGFGVLDRDERGELRYSTCGVITTLPEDLMPDRLLEIANDLQTLIAKHKPELIALEELFFGQNTTTGLKVAEVRGVIQLLAAEAGVPCIEVKPVEVKMAVTGDGHADKPQMQKMITMLLKLEAVPSPDDAADALGVAWAGEAKYRMDTR
jgi:crossover junction endodeoxyribonuclease RuvC